VGSVTNGGVSLTPTPLGFRFGYDANSSYGDVTLVNRSSLWNPASNSLGGIQVQGRNIRLDNSQIATAVTPQGGGLPGGAIEVRATESLQLGGNSLTLFPFSSWIASQVTEGASGQGGAIQITTPRLDILDGARIQSLTLGNGAAGNISVNADRMNINGYVPINNSTLQQQQVNSQISSLTSGTGNGGSIQVESAQIRLRDGGQISSVVASQSARIGGDIRIKTERLQAIGNNPLNPSAGWSGIVSTTTGASQGGDIRVVGDRIQTRDGGVFASVSVGSGQGGNMQFRASRIELRGVDLNRVGGITAFTLGAGNAGNVQVNTDRLQILDAANLSSNALLFDFNNGILPQLVTGDAGDVTVLARQSIDISGASALAATPSAIASATMGSGSAGNIRIVTQRFQLANGGSIVNGVSLQPINGQVIPGSGTGRGGNTTIRATEYMHIDGTERLTRIGSGINAYASGFGDSGNISLTTPQLRIRGGGIVTSNLTAEGNAGSVIVNANDILIEGQSREGEASRIGSTAFRANAASRQLFNLPAKPTGDTGTLEINSDHLTLSNGGLISVQHQGTGNAGQLEINARSIQLSNRGRINASTASGQGGGIVLNTRDILSLNQSSQLSAEAGGTGDGGNLRINAPFIVAQQNSDIIANADRGNGGNIAINASGIFGTAFRSALTSESDITASSQFGISGSVNIATPNINVNSGLIELPSEIVDSSQQMGQTCASSQNSQFVITGRGGIPEDPEEQLNNDRPWSDLRDLDRVTPHQAVMIPSPSLTEATTLRVNENGKQELVAEEAIAPSIYPGATCTRRSG
jgi:large exoprotein involved in heme utilization and adhesion